MRFGVGKVYAGYMVYIMLCFGWDKYRKILIYEYFYDILRDVIC